MRRHRSGQSIVELALLLPVFIVILLGILEFGWYIYNFSAIEHAARRGSEQAAKEPPKPGQITNTNGCVIEIRRQAQLNLALTTIANPNQDIVITYPNGDTERKYGAAIQVTVTYRGTFLTPLGNRFGGPNFTITAVSRRSILDDLVTQGTLARCD